MGCVSEWEGRSFSGARHRTALRLLWTLPAGFMENGETTAEAAARETLEEACAEIVVGEPFTMVNIPHINQVHLFYRGSLKLPEFGAGEESLDAALVPEAEIPWDDLAFRSVTLCLQRYFADRRRAVSAFIPPT